MQCPECGSRKLIKFGKKWQFRIDWDKKMKTRKEIQQYQCKDCGRITIKPVEKN